jgi:hypothetical protein
VVADDGLDSGLIVHVHDELLTTREFAVVPVYCIGGDSVVVEGVGWAHHSGVLNQPREVFPAQQAEDVIGEATMTPNIIHSRPRPIQVINKKY